MSEVWSEDSKKKVWYSRV